MKKREQGHLMIPIVLLSVLAVCVMAVPAAVAVDSTDDEGEGYLQQILAVLSQQLESVYDFTIGAEGDSSSSATNNTEMTWDAYDDQHTKLKYNVSFNSTNVNETPVLHDITLNYKTRDPVEDTWLWSNFTWHNSSITDKTVGWKIYYNDTLGQTNCTDVETFSVGGHIYDFNTGAGTDKWAFKKEVGVNPTANDPSNEFTDAYYAKIKVDDTDYRTDNSRYNYAAHRFNFSIDESASDISKINVTWNGRGYNEEGNGATLYIWNGTAYEQDPAPLATTDSGDWVYLTGEVTSSISNYINSGNVTVLVNQTSAGAGSGHRSYIDTDYAKVVITTGS